MAASGSFNTSGYEGRYLTFAWTEQSQDITNNKTTIAWTLKGAGTGEVQWYKAGNFKVVIAGETVYSSATRIQLYNGTLVASGTHTFTHNADGSKKFTASAEAGIYYEAVNCKGSGNFTLDVIPRASQPSCITWPNHTEDVGDFGDTISIHMNRVSSAFTHHVYYRFGTIQGDIAKNVETGTTWTIPQSLMTLLPRNNSGSGRIYVDTYNGSTKIGTKYCGFTAHVPADVRPSCSFTLEDTTGVDKIYGSPVQNLSNISVKLSETLAYGSPIEAYQIKVNGVTYTQAEAESGVLKRYGSVPVTARVTDARGRIGTAEYNMNVQEYDPPKVTALRVHRCDADGTENDQGEYVRAVFSAEVSGLSNKNTATYTLRYKKSTASSFTPVSFSDLANKYSITDRAYIFAADGNSSYDVEVEAKDRHGTYVASTSASTAFTLMNWGPDGTSAALGKVAEKSHGFEVALDNYFYGSTIQTGNRYSFSTPGVAGSEGFILMAQIEIIAANADTPITFVLSQRGAIAPMTVHVALHNSAADYSSLQEVSYTGSNYGAFLTRADDVTWQLWVQKFSAYDTITLQDWYTSKTMESRVKVTFPGTLIDAVPTPFYRATPARIESLLDFIYPVGSVYISYSHNSPSLMFGGTWVRIENAFLWGVDNNGAIGLTGGAKTHTLTAEELPTHSHGSVYSQHASGTKSYAWYTATGDKIGYSSITAGEGKAHNNMPPYVQVSIWRRTA